MKLCLKEKATGEWFLIILKYNINSDVDSHDAYNRMMNFDCFRTFNTAVALNQMSLVQPIDIDEKINEIMEIKKIMKT